MLLDNNIKHTLGSFVGRRSNSAFGICKSRGTPQSYVTSYCTRSEAYVKLFDLEDRRFSDEVHFRAVASRVMRQVLIDYSRARNTQKRYGDSRGHPHWTTSLKLEGDHDVDSVELIELDAIKVWPLKTDRWRASSRCVISEVTAEETAEALGLSVHIVRHDLRYAQAEAEAIDTFIAITRRQISGSS